MSKTYGMAGWRIGFVLGNAEIVERINLLNDHNRVGIFAPLQAAAIAALEGPQDSVDERVDAYARRRDVIASRAAGADRLRGHVLRLAPPARRAHRRDAARSSTASRSRRVRASARAAPAGPASRSPSPTRRSSSAQSGCSARSRRWPHEDRDRRSLLVVVLGRGGRALRAPGRRAAPPRARRADPDGQRPARKAHALPASAQRAARRAAGRDHPGRPLGRRAGERVAAEHRALAALDRARPPHPRGRAVRRHPRARADDAGGVRRRDLVRAVPDRRDAPRARRPRLDGAGAPLLGLPDGPDRRAHRRVADGRGVGGALDSRRTR